MLPLNPVGLHDDDFKKKFLEGELQIYCPEVKITKKGAVARIYRASGTISINPDDGAEVRLVFKRDFGEPYDPVRKLQEVASAQPGQLAPEASYCRLDAIDVFGNRWVNPSAEIYVHDWPAALAITVSCDYIETEIEAGSSEFVNFIFAERLNFPFHLSEQRVNVVRDSQIIDEKKTRSTGEPSVFQVNFHRCSADRSEKSFEFYALNTDAGYVPRDFDEKLLDAIRFCTASMAFPIMSETSVGGLRKIRLSKRLPLNHGGLVGEPLCDTNRPSDFYNLMGCYYDYLCNNANEKSELARKLNGLFTLDGVWIETVLLLISVAIESLLNDPFFKMVEGKDEKRQASIDEVINLIEASQILNEIKVRSKNVVHGLKGVRAIDRMFALQAAGAISKKDIECWKNVRNSSAHGGFRMDASELQESVDKVQRLALFVFKLVFLVIGYDGAYSDRATHGWPTREFDATSILENLNMKSTE